MNFKSLEVLKSIQIDVISLGYRTVTIFSFEELEGKQIGYSFDSNGKSLIGDEDGDWQSSWVVIGFEDETGDPIFVDTDDEDLPVYTAMHGEGEWEPDLIAVSLQSFLLSLGYMKEISTGREYPASLEENPISFEEKEHILELISEANENEIDLDFWESWFGIE